MIEFYKKRDFGELLNATFNFFKIHGKNYFKNYFLINGLLLILLVVIFVIGYREIFMQFLGSNTGGQAYFFEQYFAENQEMLIGTGILVFILFLLTMVVTYSYPVLYMKRISETGNSKITADQMLGDIKQNFGKFILYFLGLLFIIMPLFLVIFGISYVLMFLLIGFVILLFLLPTFANIVNFILYDYFHTDRGFFSSLGYAISSQFSYSQPNEKTPYWKYWGTTIIIYLIINVVVSIFSILPVLILMGVTFTQPDADVNGDSPLSGSLGIAIFMLYGISILASLVLSNLLYVASGFMYYDSRTDLHRSVSLDEISKIGSNEA